MKIIAVEPPRRSTIIDVARQAGVSPATVSNALSGKRRVEPATRERIDQAIRDLGYRPNAAAQNIRTGRTNLIAIASSMPAAIAGGGSRLGFMMEIASSAAGFAFEQNMALVLLPSSAEPEARLRHVAVDGALIIEPREDDAFLTLFQARGVPVVVIGRPFDPDLPFVDLDYPAITTLLMEHLFAEGARHFPLIVGAEARQSHFQTRQRYEELAARHGMAAQVVRVAEAEGEEGGYRAMTDILRSGPDVDAVLVPVDAFATGVMRALRDQGRRVPEDVRVATRYDGWRARQEMPGLTAVELQLTEVARLATLKLVNIIEGRPQGEAASAPPVLIPRGSTCQPPVAARPARARS